MGVSSYPIGYVREAWPSAAAGEDLTLLANL